MEVIPWNCLPYEIMENILLKVPTAEMPFNQPWICKAWTNILLELTFWIRKLFNMDFTINEDIKSVLSGFDKKVQIACLYHACLNEELVVPMKGEDLAEKLITDDFGKMLEAVGILITRSVDSAGLILYKEKIPALNIVLKLLAVRGSSVTVLDYYGFWNFSPKHDYVHLLKGTNEEANIDNLVGCVSTLKGIAPWTDKRFRELMLSIQVDRYNKAVDPGIFTRANDMGIIHIKAGTDVSTIQNVKLNILDLIVSGLESTHISWMINLAETLGLHTGYRLILCSYQLNKSSTEELFRCLKYGNVEPFGIACSSSILSSNDARQLNQLAQRLMNTLCCTFELHDDNETLVSCITSLDSKYLYYKI